MSCSGRTSKFVGIGNCEPDATSTVSGARLNDASELNKPGLTNCHAHALDGDSENDAGAPATFDAR